MMGVDLVKRILLWGEIIPFRLSRYARLESALDSVPEQEIGSIKVSMLQRQFCLLDLQSRQFLEVRTVHLQPETVARNGFGKRKEDKQKHSSRLGAL
jgi:hypothetical protein